MSDKKAVPGTGGEHYIPYGERTGEKSVVYFTKDLSAEGLRSARGYIRREISARLHPRKTPEFHFIPDDSIAYSANINRILVEESKAHPEWDNDEPAEEE